VQGLTADPVRKTYWVYTNLSLFELIAENEDRDVWKIYLDRSKFDVALKYAKVIRAAFSVMWSLLTSISRQRTNGIMFCPPRLMRYSPKLGTSLLPNAMRNRLLLLRRSHLSSLTLKNAMPYVHISSRVWNVLEKLFVALPPPS
jgi:hypothetical protein